MRFARLVSFWLAFMPVALLPLPALDACTSIMVGRSASIDGSVMTSHTCDSHRTGSQITIVLPSGNSGSAMRALVKRSLDDAGAMPRYGTVPTGEIPGPASTFGYLAPAYACMNERQVGIGESTFGGREELKSEKGLIDCEMLTRLMLERASTARDAIQLGGALIEQYGWCDEGEALTISDPQEVWLMEIVGPGAGQVGAIWAAQRVPDGHVSVIANAARIGELDLAKGDEFLASQNVRQYAKDHDYWDPDDGQPFRFYAAYNPEGRFSFASTRREWRALNLLAPSLKLNPNANVFPFSVKPDKRLSPQRIMNLFGDTYEGTEFDMVKNVTVTDEKGRTIKSPLANPFMPYDMNKVLKINGGWGELGERPMARWYCMYATVIQSRSWLPDAVGGITWFGYGNPAMTVYTPIYAGALDLPEDYRTDGRTTGFSRKSAWWAYNRVATLAAHRWGEMRKDVAGVRDPLQKQFFSKQSALDKQLVRLLSSDRKKALQLLTDTTFGYCREATQAYWRLGDELWTRYDEKW